MVFTLSPGIYAGLGGLFLSFRSRRLIARYLCAPCSVVGWNASRVLGGFLGDSYVII